MSRKKIILKNIPTDAPSKYNKEDIEKKTRKLAMEIAEMQDMLLANKNHSLLVVFQGMDSSGKDGTTREVFKYCSPAGVAVHSFKKPTNEEMSHDFLWRVHKVAPAKGMIQVFNRSHYEDILIQRVHNWIDEDTVEHRMKCINDFEDLISIRNKTVILKFYMNLSYERQEEKLQERIDQRRKNYKHNPGDWEERKHWGEYMKAYEYAINESDYPWIIAPCDQRWYRNYFIAKKIKEALDDLNLSYPALKEK